MLSVPIEAHMFSSSDIKSSGMSAQLVITPLAQDIETSCRGHAR